MRRVRAQYRRTQVAERLLRDRWTYGAQARIAQELGVSDATISRDLKAIFPGAIQCPARACRHPLERWRELQRQGRVTLGPVPSKEEEEESASGCDEVGDVYGEDCGTAPWGEEALRVAPASGQESPDERLRRLRELTNEMTEQNAAGIATDEVVAAVNVSRTPSHEPRDAWAAARCVVLTRGPTATPLASKVK